MNRAQQLAATPLLSAAAAALQVAPPAAQVHQVPLAAQAHLAAQVLLAVRVPAAAQVRPALAPAHHPAALLPLAVALY